MTISGGEPLQQIHGLLALLEAVTSRSKLSVVVFTGYTWDEVQRMEGALVLLGCVDVLVAGRYDRERRSGAGLRGSDNQTVHLLTDRYTLDDLEDVPVAEAVIEQDGTVTLSGFPGALAPQTGVAYGVRARARHFPAGAVHADRRGDVGGRARAGCVKAVCERAGRPCWSWDVADGFQPLGGSGGPAPTGSDPKTALEQIDKADGDAVFVLKDFHDVWSNPASSASCARSPSG